MSVIPLSAPTAPVPETAVPHLRLVGHDHTWHLRSVEYEEGVEVRCYECSCGGVEYR